MQQSIKNVKFNYTRRSYAINVSDSIFRMNVGSFIHNNRILEVVPLKVNHCTNERLNSLTSFGREFKFDIDAVINLFALKKDMMDLSEACNIMHVRMPVLYMYMYSHSAYMFSTFIL